LVNGTYRKLCDADRRVLEGVLRLMRGERYAGERLRLCNNCHKSKFKHTPVMK